MPIKLGGQTPIEREAVRARLESLGVKVGESGELKAEDFKKAKISLEDLERAAPKGELDLAKLETVTQHQRRFLGIGAGKVPVEAAGAAEAKATLESHRAQLDLATRKLKTLGLEGGSLAEGGKLASLASLLDNVSSGLAKVRTQQTLAGATSSDLLAIGVAHAQLLDGYASLAEAIQRDAFELSRSKGHSATVSSIFTSLASLADALPTFDKAGPAPSTAQVSEAGKAAEERLGALGDTHAVLDAFFTAAKREKTPELEQALTNVFDRTAFRGLPEDAKTRWVNAMATLTPDTLVALSGPLAGLLSNPAIASLPAPRLERAVDLLTALPAPEHAGRVAELEVARKAGKLGGTPEAVDAQLAEILRAKPGAPSGILEPALAARVDKALAEVDAHLDKHAPKVTFEIPGEPRLRAIGERSRGILDDQVAAEKKQKTERADIEKAAAQAIDALPGIAEHRAIAKKVGDLEKQRKTSEDRLERAEFIIRDWQTTKERDKWKLNHGAPIGMAYFDDQETAEVVAPRVRREESRNLGKLDAQLEGLAPEIEKMKAFEKQHIAPIEARKAKDLEAANERYHKASGALRDEAAALKKEAWGLLETAARDAGQAWIFDGSHLSSWYKNKSYDEHFSKLEYTDKRKNVVEFRRVMTGQRAEVAQNLGMFAVDARKSRDEALGHLTTNVGRLEGIVAGGALDTSYLHEHTQRVVWNRVTDWLNRFAQS